MVQIYIILIEYMPEIDLLPSFLVHDAKIAFINGNDHFNVTNVRF